MCVCVCVCVCAFEVVLVGGAVEAAECLFLFMYAYVLSFVSVILFVIYAGEEEVKEHEQEEDYSQQFWGNSIPPTIMLTFYKSVVVFLYKSFLHKYCSLFLLVYTLFLYKKPRTRTVKILRNSRAGILVT